MDFAAKSTAYGSKCEWRMASMMCAAMREKKVGSRMGGGGEPVAPMCAVGGVG